MNDFLDKPHTLPDTMHELLAVTIEDGRRLDTALYLPKSQEWHNAGYRGRCQVCLAGSIIAGSFQAPRFRTFTPWMFRGSILRKLESLDYMRIGKWILAYKSFYKQWPSVPTSQRLFHLPAPDNSDFIGWHAFRAHLASLEAILPQLREIEDNHSSAVSPPPQHHLT